MKLNKVKIKTWMHKQLAEDPNCYIDGCNEINATKLGEDYSIDVLNIDGSKNIPEVVFDVAAEIAIEYERAKCKNCK